MENFPEGPQQNDDEFKCAVRWIICGEMRATGVKEYTPAQPDDWPGMAFAGGPIYEVLDVLLREYAPKRWPHHRPTFERMQLVELIAEPNNILPTLDGIEKALICDHQEPCLILEHGCLPPKRFVMERIHRHPREEIPRFHEHQESGLDPIPQPGIEDVSFREHGEPHLISDPQFFLPSDDLDFDDNDFGWQHRPSKPFRVDHANCICDISPFSPFPPFGNNPVAGRFICIKDSNDLAVRNVYVGIPGLLTKSDHLSGSGPAIVWIRPHQQDIKIVAASAVSPLDLQIFNPNIEISLSLVVSCLL